VGQLGVELGRGHGWGERRRVGLGLKTMKQSGVDLVPKMMKQSCSGMVASRGRADLTTSISAIEPTERRSGTNRVARFGRIYGRDKVGEEGEELGRCDGAQTNRR
jgi:hypothetical protein